MTKVLSQEEVDALLKGLVEGEIEVDADQRNPENGIIPYDFASKERIIRGRMPTMEVINEHFARASRISLSMILRRTVDIQTNFVQMMKFGEFLRSLPLPSSFHIYKMEPLRGQSLLVLDSKLVFALVECFLGGTSKSRFKIEGRDFTNIERRLIQKVVSLVFQDLEKAWAPVHPVKMQMVRVEINPMFVGIATWGTQPPAEMPHLAQQIARGDAPDREPPSFLSQLDSGKSLRAQVADLAGRGLSPEEIARQLRLQLAEVKVALDLSRLFPK